MKDGSIFFKHISVDHLELVLKYAPGFIVLLISKLGIVSVFPTFHPTVCVCV